MNFFSHQPELLSTINVILGSKIGNLPATMIFGILFIVITLIGLIFLRRRFSFSTIVLTAAAIAWLPLFSQFAFSSAKEFNDTWFAIFRPTEEQIIWRYCRIDKYQNLGGGFCGVYPFVEKVRQLIPSGSRIAYVDSNLQPYLVYYLYKEYKTTNLREADYFLVYRPKAPLNKDVIDDFEAIGQFGNDQIIFKKKK